MPVRGHRKPESAKILPDEAVRALLTEPMRHHARDGYLFACCYYLACRVGEAVLLRTEHFDLAHDCVRVPTLKRKRESEPPLIEVPVLDGKDTLSDMLAWAAGRAWLFPGGDVKHPHLSVRRALILFARWRDRLGLDPAATIHSLRHTAVSRVYAALKDPVAARDFARHANVATTSHYLHRLPGRWTEARGSLSVAPARAPDDAQAEPR